jgi:outer membrane protein assembly factor BamB
VAKLGWLGPGIVLAGAAVAGVGIYLMATGRPEPGDVIDTIAIDRGAELVVRAEAGGGDRNFVELVEGGGLKWRALVPPYAGRRGAPGIAWNDTAISVRVIRNQQSEVFALQRENAAKLGGFKLAPGKGPVVKQMSGPVTLRDHDRSYEIVAGTGWHQLVAIDLTSGKGIWLVDLPAAAIEDAGLADGTVWVRQGGVKRVFHVGDGRERSAPARSSNSS